MHLILTGSTGLVGTAVLTHLLSLPTTQLSRLSILSRNKAIPLAANRPHVKIIEHSDFTNYPPSLLESLQGAHGVIWALGTSQNAVPHEKYVEITRDYTLAAAKAFSTLSDNFNFVFVSGEGATTKPGFFTMKFGRVKGETEAALLELAERTPSLNVYNVRPGFVDSHGHPEVQKVEKGRNIGWLKTTLKTYIAPLWRFCYPSGTTPTRSLSQVLTDLAMSDGKDLEGKGIEDGGRTVTNIGLRRLAHL
jgi:hypothetical protein